MFEIDSVSLTIGAVLLVAFAVPFFMYSSKSKKEKKKRDMMLEDYLKANNLKLDLQESWRNKYFLGLDLAHKKLVYVKSFEDFQPLQVNLEELSHITSQEVSRMVGSGKDSRKVLDELQLQLVGKNGKVRASLEIYNGDLFSDLSGEPVLIQKWETLLKEQISQIKQMEKV